MYTCIHKYISTHVSCSSTTVLSDWNMIDVELLFPVTTIFIACRSIPMIIVDRDIFIIIIMYIRYGYSLA